MASMIRKNVSKAVLFCASISLSAPWSDEQEGEKERILFTVPHVVAPVSRPRVLGCGEMHI